MKMNAKVRLAGVVALVALFGRPAVAEESLLTLRHFEVSIPKKEAPKPVSIVLPEERTLREISAKNLLLPIEADPAAEIKPDLVE